MSIADLLENLDWDKPFFKRLPSNDTGAAPGHQGGMVIPKDLRTFFPGLVGEMSPANPTIDRRFWADLYDGTRFLSRVNTRYQFQTWGGARSPESRLTDNLAPLRNLAQAGDILAIQRSLVDLDLYRLILIRQGTSEFPVVDSMTGAARWGVLGDESPMTEVDYKKAVRRETKLESGSFEMFDKDAATTTTTTTRIARSVVFKKRVTELYEGTCCVCGTALRVPNGPVELEAAHIVPRKLLGVDDARNGLALCRRHHWAFDRGLFGIDGKRLVHVPTSILAVPQNKPLQALSGTSIAETSDKRMNAAKEALEWHMRNVVLKP